MSPPLVQIIPTVGEPMRPLILVHPQDLGPAPQWLSDLFLFLAVVVLLAFVARLSRGRWGDPR